MSDSTENYNTNKLYSVLAFAAFALIVIGITISVLLRSDKISCVNECYHIGTNDVKYHDCVEVCKTIKEK